MHIMAFLPLNLVSQKNKKGIYDWEGRRLDNGFKPDINVALDEIIERTIFELQ